MELKNGTLLQNGKYRIEKVLGQGTFGITYLATMKTSIGGNLGNMETEINVTIKEFYMRDVNGRNGNEVTCSSKGGLFENYKTKFIKEARNLSKLDHPNIIKVLELFESNNTCYYVMEYCEKGSLDSKILSTKGKGLCEEETLRYAKQICEALRYMHSKKMLHLDLKPGNIVLNVKDDAVLIDFGLSKQFDENGDPESSTTIGQGTPGYAPIEQSSYKWSGFPVTMDIYALGATIYKMLVGKSPETSSVLFNLGFPYEALREKGIIEELIQIISKAMEPKEKDRYRSVNEMLEDLEKIEQPEVIVVVDESEDERYEYEGHEYVDLGLPSGLKWATCNVGANKPEDYGDYFAWGETKTKSTYDEYNSVTYGKNFSDIGGKSQYDAARANWRGIWRLPTIAEMVELENRCIWKWTTQNGVNGYKITGPSGNSIFLPAAGYRGGSSLYYAGEGGDYWSSTPDESDSDDAYSLYFNSSSQNVDWNCRDFGRSVRPVAE